jgi:predicted CXXCH cytochrome family protein
MAKRFEALTGMGVKRIGIALAVVVAAVAIPAIAWAVSIEIGGEVYPEKCTPCHADYTETDNPVYLFSHGNHITYQCGTCHGVFPHKPDGTDLPVMKECFNCHGLRHGPQGVIASGTCTDCHGDKIEDMRPAFHTPTWSGTAHVEPANEGLISECSMCHTQSQCDVCHAEKQVWWTPPQPMVYDAGSGCLSCHGSPNLVKAVSAGVKSFQVIGLDESAHRDLTCPQCHVDFVYSDVTADTAVWSVNAGLSCGRAECHGADDPATEENEDQLTAYAASVHGTLIEDGDLTSATCGSCHGSHDIRRLDTASAERALQMSGEEMCASCHEDRWANYDDSYHGAAYKEGAYDAPACWDCHPAHEVLPSADPKSSTNDVNLPETCASCHQHDDASEAFIEQTADMIHGQQDARTQNPILDLLGIGDGGS